MPVANKCGGFVSTEPPQFYHLHLSPWFITCVFITCIYHLVYHLRLSPRFFDLSPAIFYLSPVLLCALVHPSRAGLVWPGWLGWRGC